MEGNADGAVINICRSQLAYPCTSPVGGISGDTGEEGEFSISGEHII